MIYLDNAASTFVDEDVLSSYQKFVKEFYANPSSSHGYGLKCADLEMKARKQIASILKVKENEIIFTSGATEANNLAIKGAALYYKERGNHIVTSKIEHASVLEAFRQLENEFGFNVTYLDVDEYGKINIDELKNVINDNTILVSIMSVNNETGAINNIEEIANVLSKYPKVLFHSDITQSVGKISVDLSKVDMASLSLHKVHGFKGSGILVKKSYVSLLPLLSGGGQEYNLRSGTNNLPYEVSAAKTLRIAFEKQKDNYKKVKELHTYLYEELKNINGITMNSTLDGSPYIMNFSINKKASVVVEALSNKGIYVSTKSACSSKKSSTSYVLQALGKTDNQASNAIRVSFTYETNKEEIDTFIKELKLILKSIR